MELETNLNTEEPSLLKRMAYKVFKSRFSDKHKRMIFIASVLGELFGVKEVPEPTINLLNGLFDLANDPKALLLPIYAKNVIWDLSNIDVVLSSGTYPINKLPLKDLTDEDKASIADLFLVNVPEWMVYVKGTAMEADIHKLLDYINEIRVTL